MMVSLIFSGCSRQWYRHSADRDAKCLLESRQFDNRWDIPDRKVEPDPKSRLADIHDPDCGPLPPDDPAAHCYMDKPYGSKRRIEYWDRRGTGEMIDAEQWLQYLPYNEEGEVVLTKELAVDLALLHSREFQAQVEQLYLQALSLSQSRFAFDVQWAGGTGATLGLDGGESSPQSLTNPSRLSASRNFAAGGQLVVDLLNSVSYQFGGGESNFATGNLLFRLTQPLLRNAFRHVRTEGLTQSERNLLYSVRDFARFRRQFYLRIVGQYLTLLSQSQQIRIIEENIRSLELNRDSAEVQLKLETISQNQVDQIFQNLQNGRIDLIRTTQSLQASQDQFKFTLGLPAKVKIKFDESFLDPFKLNSEDVEKLSADADELANSLRKFVRLNVAPKSYIEESYKTIRKLHARAVELRPVVVKELEKWKSKLESGIADQAGDSLETRFQRDLLSRTESQLAELEKGLAETLEEIEAAEKSLNEPAKKTKIDRPRPEFARDDPESPPSPEQSEDARIFDELSKVLDEVAVDGDEPPEVQAFNRLERLISNRLIQDINDLFVAQTKIRLFLIEINAVEIDEDVAVEIALRNRLDLMNDKARVVDRYRAVEIAADRLESDLNFTASADLRTDSNRDNGIRFDGEAARYSAGLQFDGPLNRLAERNAYRAAQISYQQQRRSYMASEDTIVNSIRQDLRSLSQNEFTFQTSRQQLIAATRQVEETRRQALSAEQRDSSTTQDLLLALNGLRGARNGLISSWINYEVSRISLFIDLELLLLDESGRWINEDESLDYSREDVSEMLPTIEEAEAGSSSQARPQEASRLETESTSDVGAEEERLLRDDSKPEVPVKPELVPVNEAVGTENELSQENWQRPPERASRKRSNRRRRSDSSIIR
jgi:outer membrane protein TolC